MLNLLGKVVSAEKAFGQVLRKLRRERGLSQETLAFESELDRNYISLLELGQNSASIKTIFKLAPALDISVAEFMGMVEDEFKELTSPDERPQS